MNAKLAYQSFVEDHSNVPIFFQDWWLDLVCQDGSWDVCLDFDKAGNIRGVLPYYLTKIWALKVIKMPPLTPYLGIWFNYPPNIQKLHSRYSFEKKVSTRLIRQLPVVPYYTQNFHCSFTNWMSFHQAGFQQTTRYTYRIQSKKNPEQIFDGFHPKVRNAIRLAKKSGFTTTISQDLDAFYLLNQAVFQRKKIKTPYTFHFLNQLDNSLSKRNLRKIIFTLSPKGKILAGGYFIKDKQSAYYLAGGVHPNHKTNNALTLLIWEAIRSFSEEMDYFDFEGSMLPEVETFFRSFGGELVPYFSISKTSNKVIEIAKQLLK